MTVDNGGRGRVAVAIDAATLLVVVAVIVFFVGRLLGGVWWQGGWGGAFGDNNKSTGVTTGGSNDMDMTMSTEVLPSGVRLSRADLFDLVQLSVGAKDEESWPAIRVIVFEDYACGWCAEFDSIITVVAGKYPDHLVVTHLPLVLDTLSIAHVDVHAAGYCAADQGRFVAFRSEAYRNQLVVGRQDGWWQIGRAVDMPNVMEFRRCVADERYRSVVLESSRRARRMGFFSTPGSLIGKYPVIGSISVEEVDSLVGIGLREYRDTQ